MKLELIAPKGLAAERVVPEDLPPLRQHLLGILVDLVVELLLGELLRLHCGVGRYILGPRRACSPDDHPNRQHRCDADEMANRSSHKGPCFLRLSQFGDPDSFYRTLAAQAENSQRT